MSGDKHNLRVGDYLEHIVTAIEKIKGYTKNMDRQGFLDDEKTLDAVAKNLENIGEASKRIQAANTELTKQYPGVPWNKIYAMRIVLAHQYFRIDPEVVWDTIQNSLPELEEQIRKIRKSL